MVSLKSLGIRIRETQATTLYPLDEALALAGISTPTYYRWVKAGKITDCRIRGDRGKAHLTADAVLRLRSLATHIEYAS